METLSAFVPYVVALAIALVVELIGGWLTTSRDAWYLALKKPAWQPPGWLFGPAWTVLFLLIGLSASLAWTHSSGDSRALIVQFFVLNALFNIGWSALFFRGRRPDLAFYELVPFWASILALIIAIWPYSTTAALLLFPYLAWVTFAGVLNWTVARLNAYL
jgi:translocator protein